MSKPSSDEKQTYSVDEMMDRLREEDRTKQAKDEGELVTREDGTQVLRVKKRKRRSKQEKEVKAKKAKRNSLIKTVLLITIPLVAGLAALLITVSYRSGTFNTNLNATISERVGGNAKVSGLSPLFNFITAKKVTVAWPDGGVLDQLQLTGLEGDLALFSFLSGDLKGEDFKAKSGYLIFSHRENRNVSSRRKGEMIDLSGFDSYSSDDFSFFFGRANSPFRIQGSSVRLESPNVEPHLVLVGGELVSRAWANQPIDRGSISFAGETIEVNSLSFESPDLEAELSGALDLSQPSQSLKFAVSAGNLTGLAGESMSQFINGDINNGEGTLTFDSWNPASHELSVKCPIKYLTIKDFAFLDTLEEFYGETRYRKIEFESEREFHFVKDATGSEIRDFYLNEVGVLGLRGTIRFEGDKLSGDVFVGLPDHKRLILRDEQRDKLLTHATLEDGFFWIPLTLGGTSEKAKDNLLELIQITLGEKESAGDLFDELTR